MKYENIEPGIFHSRPNRFIAKIEIQGKEETVHVKNTGRCRSFYGRGPVCMWSGRETRSGRRSGI